MVYMTSTSVSERSDELKQIIGEYVGAHFKLGTKIKIEAQKLEFEGEEIGVPSISLLCNKCDKYTPLDFEGNYCWRCGATLDHYFTHG